MSIPYILISSDSEVEGTESSATILESGFDPKDYSKEDPSEEDTSEDEEDAPLSALPSLSFIASPPRKRTQSPSPSDTIAKVMAEAATLSPCKRFQMTSLHPVAITEATAEATTPRRMSAARH
ncbi:hypothetical protein Tco_0756962 [Tanacetum coccineum]